MGPLITNSPIQNPKDEVFTSYGLLQPETKLNGLDKRSYERENSKQDQEDDELGFSSHAGVSLDGDLETLTRVHVDSGIVHY